MRRSFTLFNQRRRGNNHRDKDGFLDLDEEFDDDYEDEYEDEEDIDDRDASYDDEYDDDYEDEEDDADVYDEKLEDEVNPDWRYEKETSDYRDDYNDDIDYDSRYESESDRDYDRESDDEYDRDYDRESEDEYDRDYDRESDRVYDRRYDEDVDDNRSYYGSDDYEESDDRYEDDYDPYDDEYEEAAYDDDRYDSEYSRDYHNYSNKHKKGNQNKILFFFLNLGMMEKVAIFIGVVIIAGIVGVGTLYSSAKTQSDAVESFATLGEDIYGVEIIGESGLLAVADARRASLIAAEETSEEETEVEEETGITVKMNLSTIQSDIKIKFNNSQTGKLIASVPFTVTVKLPDGSTTKYEDDDMDGIIYKKGISAGKYTLIMDKLSDEKYSKYTISTESQSVTVKDTIEYKTVDVSDEIKKESEVNVAKEDTAVKTEVESTLTDTVEYVESTKTEIGTDSSVTEYKSIEKSTIVDPTSAKLDSSNLLNLNKLFLMTTEDGTDESTSTDASTEATTDSSDGSDTDNSSEESEEEDTTDYTYSISLGQTSIEVGSSTRASVETNYSDTSVTWASDNTDVATVSSDGTIKGVSEGTAVISAKFSNDTTVSATITVTAKSHSYTLSAATANIAVGASVKIIAYDDGTETSVTWSTSSDSIASISTEKGKSVTVKGVSDGDATITALFSDNSEVTCEITVTSDGAISISPSSVTLVVGNTSSEITATVSGLSSTKVTWSVDDTSVATIASSSDTKATVKGVKEGTAKLTATSAEDSDLTAVITITVKDSSAYLVDKSGNTVYVKDTDTGVYRKATYSDYYKYSAFYIATEGKTYKYTGWQTIDGYTYYFDKDGNYVTGNQVIQGASYTFGSDGRLSTGSGVMGIDVSKWNGSIDWAAVKNSGVNFVIIRCGYRGSSAGALIEDSMYKKNISGALNAGLKVGVYFFTQAINEAEAVEEASMVASLVKGYSLSYPVFLDVEASNGRADSLSADQRTAVIKAFCNTMSSAGYKTGVYANKTWLNSYINTTSLTSYRIWLAQYAASPTYSRTRYDIWQYSSKGSVSGISGNVDMNISYLGY
ncbi:MAG: Ig-like domain-containing protein [Butyrivibrio sp.]|nr:Ig-like domain-containing protein [Butyrivibrio sp.]